MVDSDSDVPLDEEIPRNSNHGMVLNSESWWNSDNNHVRHSNRSRHVHYRRGALSKHRQHHGHNKTNFPCDDTDEYFELAKQARLLSNTVNDPGNHVVPQTENEARDRGKGVDHTCGSQLNRSRFKSNKPFRNQKNKQVHQGSSSTSNGLNGQRKLVRNGCISPDNISRIGRTSRHNAGPSRHVAEQVVDIKDKGKGKLGPSDCSGAQNSNRGVILHEPREASAHNEKWHGSNQRRRNNFTGKRKHTIDQPNLGETSSSVLGFPPNHSEKLTAVSNSLEEERQRDSCSEEYWSVEEPELNNQELADQSTKISQVESDEILARCLQEQFNQEAQHFEVSDEEDDDLVIARALQEEDDDYDVHGHDIMPFRRNNRERNLSMERMNSNSYRFPFERHPVQIPNRSRNRTRFDGPDMDYEMMLISQMRRGLSSSHIDIDTRLTIWEALEDAFENQRGMDISGDIHRSFYEHDEYEILSTLDEDNHQHGGATDSQINILPTSTIKGDRVEDACVICLEVPAAGDAMRHLPCLHKFHKECIDKWLARRNACPVCKSAIT